MNSQTDTKTWDLIITSNKSNFTLGLKSILRHKDLLFLFVKRDFVSLYKQTILGPLWFFIQPILTTIIFTIIFGNIAKISTNGTPQLLFYMSGIVLWNFFADCLNKTSDTFLMNQGLFGKVYFPRIIVPLSIVINNFFKLGIQLILLMLFWIYYYLNNALIVIDWELMLFPILLIVIGLLGMGFGTIISSLTTKYRDLKFLIQFGVQLLMYASPIVYPISVVPENYKFWILLNPMSSIIELFKYSITGQGYVDWFWLGYSAFFSIIIFIIGIVVFNKVEKSFIDTV